jgi:hypothetical protein
MKRTGRWTDVERVITAIAARQHGVVTRTQMIDAGVPGPVVGYRVTQGRLRALHRGVYRWGALAAPREREMAAVLACGPTAGSVGRKRPECGGLGGR